MAIHNHHSSENKILGVFTSLNSLSRQSEVFCLPEASGDIFGEQCFNELHFFFMMLIKQAVNVALPKGRVLLCVQNTNPGEEFLSSSVTPYQQPEGPPATRSLRDPSQTPKHGHLQSSTQIPHLLTQMPAG